MPTEIICSLISVCGVIVSMISSMSLVNFRLQQLEKKVDEHNSWGTKFAQQSTDIALIGKDVSYIKETIERLEKEKNQ